MSGGQKPQSERPSVRRDNQEVVKKTVIVEGRIYKQRQGVDQDVIESTALAVARSLVTSEPQNLGDGKKEKPRFGNPNVGGVRPGVGYDDAQKRATEARIAEEKIREIAREEAEKIAEQARKRAEALRIANEQAEVIKKAEAKRKAEEQERIKKAKEKADEPEKWRGYFDHYSVQIMDWFARSATIKNLSANVEELQTKVNALEDQRKDDQRTIAALDRRIDELNGVVEQVKNVAERYMAQFNETFREIQESRRDPNTTPANGVDELPFEALQSACEGCYKEWFEGYKRLDAVMQRVWLLDAVDARKQVFADYRKYIDALLDASDDAEAAEVEARLEAEIPWLLGQKRRVETGEWRECEKTLNSVEKIKEQTRAGVKTFKETLAKWQEIANVEECKFFSRTPEEWRNEDFSNLETTESLPSWALMASNERIDAADAKERPEDVTLEFELLPELRSITKFSQRTVCPAYVLGSRAPEDIPTPVCEDPVKTKAEQTQGYETRPQTDYPRSGYETRTQTDYSWSEGEPRTQTDYPRSEGDAWPQTDYSRSEGDAWPQTDYSWSEGDAWPQTDYPRSSYQTRAKAEDAQTPFGEDLEKSKDYRTPVDKDEVKPKESGLRLAPRSFNGANPKDDRSFYR